MHTKADTANVVTSFIAQAYCDSKMKMYINSVLNVVCNCYAIVKLFCCYSLFLSGEITFYV